ncbi:MAG: YhcN/YlaJ family sporulation lipoprotein [Syntrophomonadaceae bacterium]|nr:YhcN/YlaJ family sporulation lipoprotein [Syntrophomonadaceae bacterium]
MKKLISVLMLSLLLMTMGACHKKADRPAEPLNQSQPDANADANISERRVMTNRFSKLAEAVEGVEKASVVVNGLPDENGGATASDAGKVSVLIGLTLAGNPDEAQASAIEKTVHDSVVNNEARAAEVIVTRKPELVQRIDKVADSIVEGRAIAEFKEEVAKIKQAASEKL